MESPEYGRFSVTKEERENSSPEELAELEKKINKGNATLQAQEREKIIKETEKGIEEVLRADKEENKAR